MPRVAVLGANGQVGTELCLTLRSMAICEPVAVVRSINSAALLERAGVTCRGGDLSEPSIARTLLRDCDLIVDLALPTAGNYRESLALIRKRLTVVLAEARPRFGFALASTTSVYRYDASLPPFRHYRATKLFAERVAQALGRRSGLGVFVLRLGQVHGAMQACSLAAEKTLRKARSDVQVPAQQSDVVFVSDLAEAVRIILRREARPGTFNLLAAPSMSFAQVARWYCVSLGIERQIAEQPVARRSGVSFMASAVFAWIRSGISSAINHHKELLSAAASTLSPRWDKRMRFQRTRRQARAALALHANISRTALFEPRRPPPGARFPLDGDSLERASRCREAVTHALSDIRPITGESTRSSSSARPRLASSAPRREPSSRG